jgi:hypothetical protein
MRTAELANFFEDEAVGRCAKLMLWQQLARNAGWPALQRLFFKAARADSPSSRRDHRACAKSRTQVRLFAQPWGRELPPQINPCF